MTFKVSPFVFIATQLLPERLITFYYTVNCQRSEPLPENVNVMILHKKKLQ